MKSILAARAFVLAFSACFIAQSARAQSTPVPAPPSGPDAPPAAAEDGAAASRTLDNTVSVFGVLGYGYSGLGGAPGVGARFQKRLASDLAFHGPKLHDDIGFEGGVDFVHYSWSTPGLSEYSWSYNELSLLAGVVWNVWISDEFAVYPKMELAYGIGSVSTNDGVTSPSYGGLWFQGAGGVVYKTGPVALRAEAGWRALRLGAGVTF